MKSLGVTPLSGAPKAGQCGIHTGRVLRARVDEEVEVSGGMRLGVMRERITANDHVSNALCVELAQEIALILLHETRCLSAGRTTVQVSAQLPCGLKALGGGPAAPVAVGLRLLLCEIGHFANGLVHGIA